MPAAALAADREIGLRAGVERITGDYGADVDVQDLYVPVTVLVDGGRLGFRATVPYLEVEFIDPVDSSTYTESGLGDAVIGVTWFDALAPASGAWSLDATLKIKLPTGDETRGLGTGEADYTAVADLRRALKRGAFVASVGYRVRGEPAGVDLEDGWLASVGAVRRLAPTTTGSVFVDYRASSVPGYEAIREVSAALSRRLGDSWRVQGYLVKGLSDTTLDLGAGLSVRRDF
jgi:hypothetical protein